MAGVIGLGFYDYGNRELLRESLYVIIGGVSLMTVGKYHFRILAPPGGLFFRQIFQKCCHFPAT